MATAAFSAAATLLFGDLVDALVSQHATLQSQYAELQAKHTRLQQELLQRTMGGSCASNRAQVPQDEPRDVNAHRAGVDEPAAMAHRECHTFSIAMNESMAVLPPAEPAGDPTPPAWMLSWQEPAAGGGLLHEGAVGEQEPDAHLSNAADRGAEGEQPVGRGLPGDATALPVPTADSKNLVEVLPTWADDGFLDPKFRRHSLTSSEVTTITSCDSGYKNRLEGQEGTVNWFMIHPDSPKRIGWDMTAMIMLGYDITMTPMMVFELPANTITDFGDLATTIFWTLDIGLTFLIGYWQAHSPEMRPLRVAYKYMRQSFVPDVLIAIVDWTMYGVKESMSHTSDSLRLSKTIRVLRILRILRLIRLVRLPDLFSKALRSLQSDTARSIAGIARNLLVIIAVNHFVACLWYAMRLADDPSWTDVLDSEGRGIPYRYWTAMHWSVTQFTPASMEVQPRNTFERQLAICMVFFGLVVFSSFVSTITATMASIRTSMRQEQSTKANVMCYMSERMVSTQLGVKIIAFMASHRFSDRPVHREDIALFSVLPQNLQLMLDWEVNGPLLARHQLLHHLVTVDDACMLELCSLAEELSLLACEELFHPGKLATAMYFTVSRCLRCFHGFVEFNPLELDCAKHRWLCEPAAWLRWKHRGRGVAVTTCSFVTLSSDAIHSVVCKEPHMRKACQIYARLLRDELRARTDTSSRVDLKDCDMSGDFGDDLDSCLEKAQAAFAKAAEILGPWEDTPKHENHLKARKVRRTRSLPEL